MDQFIVIITPHYVGKYGMSFHNRNHFLNIIIPVHRQQFNACQAPESRTCSGEKPKQEKAYVPIISHLYNTYGIIGIIFETDRKPMLLCNTPPHMQRSNMSRNKHSRDFGSVATCHVTNMPEISTA